MLQPLACVINTVDKLGDVSGKRVAVIGQGPIGMLFSHVLKARGAEHVAGIDRVDRSELAGAFGVDETVWSSSDRWAAMVEAGEERADLVVEAVGHQVSTLTDAVKVLADEGQICYFGIPDDPVYPLPLDRLLRACGRLYAGYTPPRVRRNALERADRHLRANPGIVEPYVTHKYRFAQAQDGFLRANQPRRGQLKVILEG